MSTVSSGVGLISGLNYQSIIDQMMKIEAQPRDQVVARMNNLDAQKTAYLDISARLTALLARIQVLTKASLFQTASATSSQPSILTATASATAPAGMYQFSVRSLAATQQLVSRGFQSRTASLSPGTLTVESAQARVERGTSLEELNAGAGVQRGSFKIQNAAGQQAVVNIADAVTLADIVDKVNAAGIAVTAETRGDALVLKDASGGTGALRVLESSGGRTAADLGFTTGHTQSTTGELAGSDLLYLADLTRLSDLNDGLGVGCSIAGGDFAVQVGESTIGVDLGDVLKAETRLERLNHGQGVRLGRVRITSRDGSFREVDLTGAKNAGDVKSALDSAFGDSRLSVVISGSHLVVTDKTTVASGQTTYDFSITDVTGHAAVDLGLNVAASSGKITGRDILQVGSVADVLAAINYATGNDDGSGNRLFTAALGADKKSLTLQSAGGVPLVLTSGTTSHALADLGFADGTFSGTVQGRRILGGLDTVLLKTLNGGAGLATGTIRIEANGTAADVDLAGAETLADVVGRINDAAEANNLGIAASYDSTGTRLVIANSNDGTGAITVSDVGDGQFAQATGLAQSSATIRSNNLQRQYIAGTTRLADLSNGRGVSAGTFKITNSLGVFKTITVAASDGETLQDVIDEINDSAIGVQARLNATGDGLLIVDSTGGAGALKIEDQEGTTAHDLNIAGQSNTRQIDGAFEFKLSISGSETLESLAARVGTETTLAAATLLNDGTGIAPYRLSISSRQSGQGGELVLDDGGAGLGIATLTQAQDAHVLFGGNSGSGVLLTSSSNTLTGVADGLDLTLSGVSDTPVTVTVDRNIQGAVDALSGLVTDVNAALTRLKAVSGYNQDTETKGVLFGEGTVQTIENRLSSLFSGTVTGTGSALSRLSQVGLSLGSGAELTFDEQAFRAAYAANPEGVVRFFTDTVHGAGTVLKNGLQKITDTSGLIPTRTASLDQQKQLLQERVDRLNDLLSRKQSRLQQQFQSLESALTLLQSQQATLTNFASSTQSSGSLFSTSQSS